MPADTTTDSARLGRSAVEVNPRLNGSPTNRAVQRIGVEMLGTGRYLPPRTISNADLEAMMDTSDEWIVKRTGIARRHQADASSGEHVTDMAAAASRRALDAAGITPADLDLILVATVSPELTCPSTACMMAERLAGDGPPINCAAFDLSAACSGWVYGLNVAHGLMQSGTYRHALVVGAERLTQFMEYSTRHRDHAVIFGDGAGAVVLGAADDTAKGVVAQAMRSDGKRWRDLYIPREGAPLPSGEVDRDWLGLMRMNGRSIFKFAVTTFGDVIEETLERAGLTADDIDEFVCHQSNIRILDAARDRFDIPPDKMFVNIDRLGNTSAASVPICLDEMREAGRLAPGQRVMFVALGAGLTWATSLWQL